MTDDEWRLAEGEWHDAKNWRIRNLVYVAPQDSRVWVRKRHREFGGRSISFTTRAGCGRLGSSGCR